jgi:hypothetical protein
MNSNKNTKGNIVQLLRALVPTRPLTLSESYTLAEQQASRALALLDIKQPPVDLGWIVDLPRVDVQLSPRYQMDGFSGATTFANGRYLVIINKNDGHARRRFTLAHEFKHLLDYTAAPVIHRALGYGDQERQRQQVEAICNHFAASLLMPRTWVKQAWANGIQDVAALAGLFNVSDEAMAKRLRFLGFIDGNSRSVKTYFRLAWLGQPMAA